MAGKVRTSIAALTGVALIVMLAAAGLAWHECVLLASAAATAHRLFLLRMDIGAPWDAWRAGVRCVCAGVVGLVAASALAGLIGAGLAGVWAMAHEHEGMVVAMLTATALVLISARRAPSDRTDEARFWTVLLGVVLLSFSGASAGLTLLPCLAATSILVWLALASWQLARDPASSAFRSGQRM